MFPKRVSFKVINIFKISFLFYLRTLRYLGTWALKALSQFGIWALRYLRHFIWQTHLSTASGSVMYPNLTKACAKGKNNSLKEIELLKHPSSTENAAANKVITK